MDFREKRKRKTDREKPTGRKTGGRFRILATRGFFG
jgi:hypothetical protein